MFNLYTFRNNFLPSLLNLQSTSKLNDAPRMSKAPPNSNQHCDKLDDEQHVEENNDEDDDEDDEDEDDDEDDEVFEKGI